MIWLVPFMAAAAPFVVWPVEIIFPYPFVVEEVVKLAIIWLSPKTDWAMGLVAMLLAGLGFTVTENFFYLFNLSTQEDFLTRFGLTLGLHTSTFVLLYFFSLIPRFKNAWRLTGLSLAMGIHWAYNFLLQGRILG